MNLRRLSDDELLREAEGLGKIERDVLTKILWHLLEIDRRRLFSKLGFQSINEFAMRTYGYDKDQASRRISAMRLLKEIPEIEPKIESGTLSLTHIEIAQKLFRHESRNHDNKLSVEQKLEVLQTIEGKSTREAQSATFALASSPMTFTIDQFRYIGDEKVELRCSAPQELESRITRLKGIFAHSQPGINTGELLMKLADLGLEKWDLSRQNVDRKTRTTTNTVSNSLREHIPLQTRREVWRRDQGKCTKCSSTFALQIDHIRPVAVGGDNSLKNLRLLCRSCNQRAAMETFGVSEIQEHLKH